ncbi:MAG: type IV pilin [Asgard group archaeon]|nr:type IV pilin [Asgard group archaeon]
MLKTLKRLVRRRKAVSPVISAILLIALTVISVSIVYFVVLPFMNRTNIYAAIYDVKDTNKDSRYDFINLFLSNTGTRSVEISEVIIWTTPKGALGDSSFWIKHEGWEFIRASGNVLLPSNFREESLNGSSQIELTINEETYYRLEIIHSASATPYFSDWTLLNDQVDFSDLVNDYRAMDLQAEGFAGTIDVPGWSSNNYRTTGGPEHGPFFENRFIWLPVPEETKYVKFFTTGQIVIFHSTYGNLTDQPTFQQIDRTSNPFRANKLYILGLAGSWGDEFPTNAIALTMTVTYTDGSTATWEMGHDYIDDWWYDSNADTSPTHISECVSAPYGKIVEIDLGTQLDWPYEPIHSHTATFHLDVYKYIRYISFTDPGNDASGPHLLSITAG